MVERMHRARVPGVAYLGRRRVGLGQKIARLQQRLRRLPERSIVDRRPDRPAFGGALERFRRRKAQRFERALNRPAHRLDRDRGRAKRRWIEVFRERRATLRHQPLDQPGERAHQRQEDGDADHVVGGMIGGEQSRRIDLLRRADDERRDKRKKDNRDHGRDQLERDIRDSQPLGGAGRADRGDCGTGRGANILAND